MTESTKVRIEYSRLLGEYIGTVSGVMMNDILEDLKERLGIVLERLRTKEKDFQKQFYESLK